MPITPQQAEQAMQRAQLLYGADEVMAAVDRMARDIARDTRGKDPIVMCVMNGGVVLTGLLLPRLDFMLRLDYLHATRYRGRTFGTELIWRKHHELELAGETVVIVDDILDEGHTLAAILDYCERQAAERVLSAVLVEKQRPREVALRPEYVGLKVPDRYVFGFGMDYRGYWRNAAGIYAAQD